MTLSVTASVSGAVFNGGGGIASSLTLLAMTGDGGSRWRGECHFPMNDARGGMDLLAMTGSGTRDGRFDVISH
jgi:hypothetical protein